MGTFPPSVAPPGAGTAGPSAAPAPAAGGSPAPGGASPLLMQLSALSQVIQRLGTQFPQAQQGVTMMMTGLRMVQAAALQAQTPQPSPAPPTGG